MARQNINLGTDPNDGEGDNLRSAFDKVNDNFIEVYTAGPVGSNIVISGNVISSNVTNANIELSPNGVGKVVVKNDLRPDNTNLRYLGDTNLRFRGAYIGTAGINSTGDIVTTGNISANNIQYTGEVFVGDLKGSVFADDSTVIVDAIDNVVSADSGVFGTISTLGNVTADYFIGNGSQLTGISSTYGNSNVESFLASYTGNVSAGNISVVGVATISDGISTWTFNGNSIQAPSGSQWRSEPDDVDDFFESAPGGFISLQALYPDGDIASRVNLELSDVRIVVADSPNKTWRFNDTGTTDFPNFTLPAEDGNTGEVFITDGSGNISWGTATSIGNLSVNDTTISAADDMTLTATGNLVIDSNLITAGNIEATVNGFDIGYLEIPQVSLSANRIAAPSDSGKHYYSTASSDITLTIPSNANVAFPTGTTFTIVVQGPGNLTLAEQNEDVNLYLAGNAISGNRIIGSYGEAYLLKVATNTWFVNGIVIS